MAQPFILAWLLRSAVALCAAAALHAEDLAPPRAVPAISTIYEATDPHATAGFRVDRERVRQMVDALVTRMTGTSEPGTAWRKLLDPNARIGIKVATEGAPLGGTRVEVVEAVLLSLESAGFDRRRIAVWDRDPETLRRAGYTPARLGCRVEGIPPGAAGYDPDRFLTSMVLGSLIHGDLLFEQHGAAPRGSADNLSNRSHLSRILSRELDQVLNIPSATHSARTGIHGAIASLAGGNVDNWRRFYQENRAGDPFLPEIHADPAVGGKVALVLMDGLRIQYAGGPAFDPNHTADAGALWAGTDPVAVDGIALQRINDYRIAARMPLIGKEARHLLTAEEMGLGNLNPRALRVVHVQ